jgi:hypothetical protein
MVTREGWAWPSNSRKAHYFGPDERSLCRKWARFTTPFQTNQEPGGPDDCKDCVRRLAKARPA